MYEDEIEEHAPDNLTIENGWPYIDEEEEEDLEI